MKRNEIAQDTNPLIIIEENIAGGILCCYNKERFPVKYINSNLLDFLGYTKEEFMELYGNHGMGMICEKDYGKVFKEVNDCIQKNKDWKIKYRMKTKGGHLVDILSRGRGSIDIDGDNVVTSFMIDITDSESMQAQLFRQAEELEKQNRELNAQAESLRMMEQRFRIALSKSKSVVFDFDFSTESVCLFNLYEKEKDRTIQLADLDKCLFEDSVVAKGNVSAFYNMFKEAENGVNAIEKEIKMITHSGQKKWYCFWLDTIYNRLGVASHSIGMVEDVTQKKIKEKHLRFKAECDFLTKLYNKGTAMERIENKIHSEEGNQGGVFMMIDLDCFKSINDTFGHPCGDSVLRAVANILKNNFREGDIVGRLGGDEFCVFVSGTENLQLIKQKAQIIHEEINAIDFSGMDNFQITVSIGITLCNKMERSFQKLYEEADKALYYVKRNGKNNFYIYGE